MPSWVKEKDGLEWYDEAFTTKQTDQQPDQLEKKAKAGKIRRYKQRGGGFWYARPDVEMLRESYLRRSKAARGQKRSEKKLEARFKRQDKECNEAAGKSGWGPVSAHFTKVMLSEIEAASKKGKK